MSKVSAFGQTTLLILSMAGSQILFGLAAPVGADEANMSCGRRVAGMGFPRPNQQLAELSAIGQWLEAAGKLSDDMPSWHRARGKSMKCEEIGTLGRISCLVVARPCLGPQGSAEAAPGSPQ